jgi:pyruvate formate lyase activating enzyme
MDYFLSFLETRSNWLEAVCVSGGEPLLHEDLDVLLRVVKDRNLLVKIDTNGAFPDRLEQLIEKGLVDSVAMDVKAPLGKYRKITASQIDTDLIVRSVAIIRDSGLDYIFRTTVVPGFIDEEDMEEICRLIEGAKIFQIQQFEPLGTVDKKLENVIPYSREKLQAMADKVKPFFSEVKVEGI